MPQPNLSRLARLLAITFAAMTTLPSAEAQPEGFNYDEAKVPAYTLPDPLVNLAGEPVADAAAWQSHRRGEVLRLFEDHVFGRTPAADVDVRFELLESDSSAYDGRATRKQVRAHFAARGHKVAMDILIYLPNGSDGSAPLFVGLNFNGNHTTTHDPAVPVNQNWMRYVDRDGVTDHRSSEAARGTSAKRWPIEQALERGYGVATIYCGDIDPDFDDGFQNGIHPLFYREGQTAPTANEWGTIGAWAWGLSRAMDYFESDDDIDARKMAVLGHSRLGKASLWAGATDERFAIVISNNSGCGGAALARRRFGETVQRINTAFPHWFNDTHPQYNENESALPVDHHMLIALMAPRPVYIASATEDLWADPHGEFLSGKHAEPVYALFGKDGLNVAEQPAPDHPVGDHIGYHLRTGSHNVTPYDWAQYLNFADLHFGR
ncbi:acetylxylan esterase [Opitutaceae bacterium]|nr:acetylxylan esterase [Opitutaceae bacterium]